MGFSRRLACKLVASNPTREHARSLHKKIKPLTGLFLLAERVGFEPTVDLRPRLISSHKRYDLYLFIFNNLYNFK